MQHGSDCPRAAAASQRASHYAGMHFAAAADDGDENRRNYAAGINIIGNQQQVQDTFSLQGQKTGRYNQDAHGSAAKACARLFEKIVGHNGSGREQAGIRGRNYRAQQAEKNGRGGPGRHFLPYKNPQNVFGPEIGAKIIRRQNPVQRDADCGNGRGNYK